MKIGLIQLEDDQFYKKETILPYILANNIQNELLYQNIFFTILISEIDHPAEPLYRKFYESVYLKHPRMRIIEDDHISFYYSDDNKMILRVSLGELIGFLNMSLPPLILNTINKTGYKDCDEFINVLKELLMTEGDSQGYYVDRFKEAVGLKMFETKTSYSFDRTQLLRQFNGGTVPIVDVEAIQSRSLSDFINDNDDECELQCMINVLNKKQITEVVWPIIDELDPEYDSIINLYKDDSRGYFIELYVNSCTKEKYPNLTKLINSSYDKILNN